MRHSSSKPSGSIWAGGCRGGEGPGVPFAPDVAVAVLGQLRDQLRRLEQGLGKVPGRPKPVPAARRNGGAVAAIPRTGQTLVRA